MNDRVIQSINLVNLSRFPLRQCFCCSSPVLFFVLLLFITLMLLNVGELLHHVSPFVPLNKYKLNKLMQLVFKEDDNNESNDEKKAQS